MDSSRVVLPPISTLMNDVDQHHHHQRQRLDSARPLSKLTIETSPSIVVTDPRHASFHPPSPQSPVPCYEMKSPRPERYHRPTELLSPISTPVSPQSTSSESFSQLSSLPPPAQHHRSSWSPDTTQSSTLQIPNVRSHSRSYPSSPVDQEPINPFKRRASDQTSNFSFHMQQVKSSAITTPPRRRRGRPPNATEQNTEGPWTFLTPTVWDVGANNDKRDQDYYSVEPKATDHTVGILCDMSMDTMLTTPKRKRGRKPKHILEGNGCFVWKEIKSKRRSRKQPSE
ncbi:hypothetical protein INT43_006520 [Umbelopsis isabellina]|uniref:Uncharacterized protein n=1 Tax=Mortierella isabellina TaxID=91625 RepID=A0A8H7Q1U7_MORIS|nr:hypothetical protein INT43_006520 [Umbelopsis isabellina]